MWQTDAIVSIVGDTAVTGTAQPILRRQGDTWDAKRELLLSLRDCFPARAPWRQRLTERATEAIAAQESAGVARYHDNWREELVGVFHPRQFYLCQDGMHYFFPFQSIAPAIEGIPTFCMAYDEVNGPFVPRI